MRQAHLARRPRDINARAIQSIVTKSEAMEIFIHVSSWKYEFNNNKRVHTVV
jgi:hypothetical protein